MGFFKDRVAPVVLGHEGGYVDNPRDPGGETNWGITQETARHYGYRGSMRDMDRSTAVEIYEQVYFIAPRLNSVATIAPSLSVRLCDIAVNQGVIWAGKHLQVSLNALNRGGHDYPDIVVDGQIGNATIRTLQEYLACRRVDGEAVLLTAVRCLQGARYLQLGAEHPTLEDFMYGWLRRTQETFYETLDPRQRPLFREPGA